MSDKFTYGPQSPGAGSLANEWMRLNQITGIVQQHLYIRGRHEMVEFIRGDFCREKTSNIIHALGVRTHVVHHQLDKLFRQVLEETRHRYASTHNITSNSINTAPGRKILQNLQYDFNALLPEISTIFAEGYLAAHDRHLHLSELKPCL